MGNTLLLEGSAVKDESSRLNLFSFSFLFLFSIFRTRVRVRVTRLCCYTLVTSDDMVISHMMYRRI